MLITLDDCPRCGGAVLDYSSPITDSPLCMTCGWRKVQVSADVQSEFEKYFGMTFAGGRKTARQVGTGKPPLSGWERKKRRRERETKQLDKSLVNI